MDPIAAAPRAAWLCGMQPGLRLALGLAHHPTNREEIMADKPKPIEPKDPKAPQPEKDDERLRDTSRPNHPDEREKDRG